MNASPIRPNKASTSNAFLPYPLLRRFSFSFSSVETEREPATTMASLTLSSFFTTTAATRLSRLPKPLHLHPHATSTSFFLSTISRPLKTPPIRARSAKPVKASLGFSGSYFEGDFDYDYDGDGDEEGFGLGIASPDAPASTALLEDKGEPPCPPGCRRYECIVVLRPDISEEKRLAFIQQYEEILVAGGAMYVEVFNRGVAPLSYSVQKVNKDGTKDTYGDGVYLLFTFFTKPESINVLESQLRQDFSVIRHSVLKVEKLKEDKKEKKEKKERQKVPVI